MAIRLFAGGQFGVLGFAQDAMRNRLGRFTLRNLQRGGGSLYFFYRRLRRRNSWDSGMPAVLRIEK
jgi:hypothetical protein